MKFKPLRLLAGIVAIAGLFSCATQAPYSPATAGLRSGDAAVNRSSIDAMLNTPAERPGLATGWGNEKVSSLIGQSFIRASSKPAGTDVIYYNDKKGVDAMAPDRSRVEGLQSAAGGLVEWGIKGAGGYLSSYKTGLYQGYLANSYNGRRLVAGESNSTYTIAVRNRSKSTLEIVASVDGLDVMDGKAASFSKRGYLVNPGATLEIDGFRTSENSVAAFKFSSVSNSYANLRHGDTRNIGVLGIAVFTQKGVDPWTWMPAEINRRGQARSFAEAPGR